MSKKYQPSSTVQLERRRANLAMHKFWDQFWTIAILVIGVSFLVLLVTIQISHHI